MRNAAAAPCIALDPNRYSADIQSLEAQSAVGGCFDVGILVSPLLFGVGIVTHGALISPFFGFPFFTTGIDSLYSGPIFTAPTYITPDQTMQSIGDQTGEDLRSQVGQLRTEVQQLQTELAAARGQSTPTSAAAQNAVTLILKDGRRIEAAGYALVGSTLWILNAQDATKISLSDVDVDATQKENQKRGINVVIPPNTSQRRLR
jgi:hypothetical protein